jgi:sugar fermentation stimulation protein A
MEFPAPLIPAVLLRRYKRFLADVRLSDGREATVHCPNPGAMTGLADPGTRIHLLPGRGKLPYSWELSETSFGPVGINTARPNRLVEEALAAGGIPELSGYGSCRREVSYGENSRIDLLLEEPGRSSAYVEIKNVHMFRQPPLAEFPDCVTARGTKHLLELARMAQAGARAVMLYVIQLNFCDRFSLAADIDPAYCRAFAAARAAGVEAYAYRCHIGSMGITVADRVPVVEN